jgi:5-methylcytosine-specific restriction protein A
MPVSRIAELPAPVTAAKADWLVASSWIGFTPPSEASDAAAQCSATINRQFGTGYVLEYITRNFGKPNPGFASGSAGRLVAVHRLRASARPWRAILGDADFERMQDMWSEGAGRKRWSVAFPIIESYEIATKPRASSV